MKNVRTNRMSLLTLIVVGFFLLSSAVTFAQKANFSGIWTYNVEKSKAPDNGFRMSASKITVIQDDLNMNSEKVLKGRDGEDIIVKDIITLDGKECENVAFQEIKKKSIATWSADGKLLTINSSMNFDNNGESMNFKWSETWTFGVDGNTLILVTTSMMQNEEVKETAVYDKGK